MNWFLGKVIREISNYLGFKASFRVMFYLDMPLKMVLIYDCYSQPVLDSLDSCEYSVLKMI
jgi:hypothetical protein